MAKRYLALKIDQTPPEGPVTEASPPRPVRAVVKWNMGEAVEVDAWALAWTKAQVLIWFRHSGPGDHVGNLAWVDYRQVRRR